jgi:arylsulfatase
MEKDQRSLLTRRDFMKMAGYASLSAEFGLNFVGPEPVRAQTNKLVKAASGGPYNILMIVSDQERYMKASELPIGYQLPGHERLADIFHL